MKRIAITIITMLVCLVLAWIGGFDFDKRGVVAFMVASMTVSLGFSAWAIAGCLK